MCIPAWNNRITCSAGHARRKNGTSRGISRISTQLSKINNLGKPGKPTFILTTLNRSKKDERVLLPPLDYTFLLLDGGRGSIQIWKKGERADEMRWKFRTKRGSPRSAAAPPRSVPLSPSSSRFVWPQCERGPSTATTARVRKRAKGNGDNAARRSARSFALLPKRSIECPEEAKNGHGPAGRCRFKSLWERS